MIPRRTGFTLLELLVALTMAATIAGSLAASLYSAYHARNSVDAAIEAAHSNDAVGDIIARDLVNAVPPNGILASTFLGDDVSLQFCCSGGDSHSTIPGDIKQVEFVVITDPDVPGATNLVRNITTNLLAPVQPDPVQEVICRNVQSFTVSYFDGTSWYDAWDSTQYNNTLPLAVELTIVQASPGNPDEERQIVRQVVLPCGVAASSTSSTTGGGS